MLEFDQMCLMNLGPTMGSFTLLARNDNSDNIIFTSKRWQRKINSVTSFVDTRSIIFGTLIGQWVVIQLSSIFSLCY